jgi:hypothetical protein
MKIGMHMFAHIIGIILLICGGNLGIVADVTSVLGSSSSSSSSSSEAVVAGRAGFAVHIGGMLSGIVIKSDSSLPSRLSNFSQITISLWLQIAQQQDITIEQLLIDKSSVDGNEYRLSIINDITRNIRQLKVYFGQSNVINSNSLVSIANQKWDFIWIIDIANITSSWQHIAVTWDGKTVTAYLNGTAVEQTDWNGQSIVDYGNDLIIASNRIDNFDSKGHTNYRMDGVAGVMDSLAIYGVALTPSVILSSYRSVPPASDPDLPVNFNFDEGSGLQSLSAFSDYYDKEILAQLDENYNRYGEKILRWISSSAPIGDTLDVRQGYPGAIQLFASGMQSGNISLMYQLTKYPSNGSVYITKNIIINGGVNGIPTFPALDRELTLDDTIASNQSLLIYVPIAGYSGTDSFVYKACLDRVCSNEAVISITVEEILKKQQLIMDEEASITLEDFKITDSDSGYDVNAPLTVNVSAPYKDPQTYHDPVTISLASTHGLYFAEAGGNGIGQKDVLTTFNAYSDRIASAAMTSLELSLPRTFNQNNKVEFSLDINVTDNDPIGPLTGSGTVPIEVAFSSIPLILSIYPAVLNSNKVVQINAVSDIIATVDVIGTYFSDDVSACSIGGFISPSISLSETQLRCAVPVGLEAGRHELFLITHAGVFSNAMNFYTLPPLIPLSVSPSLGSSRGGAVVIVTVNSTAFALETNSSSGYLKSLSPPLFCIFGDQSVPASMVGVSEVTCKAPSAINKAGAVVQLSIAYNEGDSQGQIDDNGGGANSIVTFTYASLYQVQTLQPLVLPPTLNASSVSISLYGNGFYINEWNAIISLCRVGGVQPASLTRISDNELLCQLSPSWIYLDSDQGVNINGRRLGSRSSTLSIELAANGVDFTDTGVIVGVALKPQMASISPLIGPLTGSGTLMTVMGSNFDASFNMTCIFNSTSINEGIGKVIEVQATVASDSLLTCMTPAASLFRYNTSIANLRVDVTLGAGLNNPVTSSLRFEYYATPHVDLVYPLFASVIGSSTSNSTVINADPVAFHGTDFFKYENQRCLWILNTNKVISEKKFVRYTTDLIVIRSNLSLCNIPAVYEAAEYSLFIAWNGLDTDAALIYGSFQIISTPTVVSISSLYGFPSITSRLIIAGDGLLLQNGAGEVFGGSCLFGSYVTSAMIINSTTLSCSTPLLPKGFTASYPISLSYGPYTFNSPFVFTFIPEVTLTSVSPFGGSVTGGNSITIRGEYFEDRSIGGPYSDTYQAERSVYMCSFNGVLSSAIYISSNAISCLTIPVGVQGTVAVSLLVFDGSEYSLPVPSVSKGLGGLRYRYWNKSSILYTSPRVLPVGLVLHVDGSPVLLELHGGPYRRSTTTQCVITLRSYDGAGTYTNGDDYFISPEYITNNTITCSVPYAVLQSSISGTANEEIIAAVTYTAGLTIECHIIVPIVPAITIDSISPDLLIREAEQSLLISVKDVPIAIHATDTFVCLFKSNTQELSTLGVWNTIKLNTSANVSCKTPHSLGSGGATVSILFDNAPLTYSTEISVYVPPVIGQLTPRRCPLNSLCRVTVGVLEGGDSIPFGSYPPACVLNGIDNIMNDLYIMDSINNGTDRVDFIGTYQSKTSTIDCDIISSVAGNRLISIFYNNSGLDSENSRYEQIAGLITFYDSSNGIIIEPSSGEARGGMEVHIYGDKFRIASSFVCKFGILSVPGVFQSPTEILCVTPSMVIGSMNLTVIIDTVESFSSVFRSYNFFGVSSVYPALTTVLGGNVTLYHNYIEMNTYTHQLPVLSCVFNGVVVPSVTTNETAVTCVAPPYYSIQGHNDELMNGFKLSPISITANGVSISQDNDVTLMYVPSPVFSSIVPSVGPLTGGTSYLF